MFLSFSTETMRISLLAILLLAMLFVACDAGGKKKGKRCKGKRKGPKGGPQKGGPGKGGKKGPGGPGGNSNGGSPPLENVEGQSKGEPPKPLSGVENGGTADAGESRNRYLFDSGARYAFLDMLKNSFDKVATDFPILTKQHRSIVRIYD